MGRPTTRRNGSTAIVLLTVVGGMVGLAYASVPLYQLFCQVTGYGGTPKTEAQAPVAVTDKTIVIRFDSNISPKLGWRFKPEQKEMTVRIGETYLAAYQATSLESHTTTGTASYNVTPFKAGAYFSKVDCFCFTEQTLTAGQKADMPVSFYVDPAILTDPSTQDLKTITLSYTFFPVIEEEAKPEPTAGLASRQQGG